MTDEIVQNEDKNGSATTAFVVAAPTPCAPPLEYTHIAAEQGHNEAKDGCLHETREDVEEGDEFSCL